MKITLTASAKKVYNKPTFEVEKFPEADIVTASMPWWSLQGENNAGGFNSDGSDAEVPIY